MAGRGPAPKLQRTRANDTARRQDEFTVLAADGLLRGPDLPPGDWPERTAELWHALRTSPMAATWLPVDWTYLLDVLDLHRAFVNGETKLAGEIRLRLSQYGVGADARLRLRLKVDGTPAPGSELEQLRKRERELTPGSARRRRLLKSVDTTAL